MVKRLALNLLIGLLAFLSNASIACAPPSPYPVFVYGRHPDLPLEPYVAGRLDVVQPTFARLYLLIAYRYWINQPLDPEEQLGAVATWRQRVGLDQPGLDSVRGWLNAHRQVEGTGKDPSIEPFRRTTTEGYYWYLNCLPDAFTTATATLTQRIAEYGARDPWVKEWLAGQDRVFAGCDGKGELPPLLGEEAPVWLKTDRVYQRAAALFYDHQYDEAEEAFSDIAKDAASPWAVMARYLVARVRLQANDHEGAGELLRDILKEPALKTIHPAAQRLLGRVAYLSESNRVLRSQLAGQILSGSTGMIFRQLAGDYLRILDDFDSQDAHNYPPSPLDPLTDWMKVFGFKLGEAAFEVTLRQWQANPSLPWLLAALTHLPLSHAQAPVILEAAARISPDSPAFVTSLYYRLRYLLMSHRIEEARELLGAIPTNDRLGPSARNLFAIIRMALAQNIDQIAALIARPILAVIPDSDSSQEPNRADWCRMAGLPVPPEVTATVPESAKALDLNRPPPRFDNYTVALLNNLLPLVMLDRLTEAASLSSSLRVELRRTVWVRAALLGEKAIGHRQSKVLQQDQPEMAQGLAYYLAAKDDKERSFAAISLILRLPGLSPYLDPGLGRGFVDLFQDHTPVALGQIDRFRDNWWCQGGMALQQRHLRNWEEFTEFPSGMTASFLSEQEQAMAKQESAKLDALGTAPNYLVKQVIQRFSDHPKDPRLAETLHLAVRATRYGCTDDATSLLSKKAFQLLHKQFPKSEWTEKTPYRF